MLAYFFSGAISKHVIWFSIFLTFCYSKINTVHDFWIINDFLINTSSEKVSAINLRSMLEGTVKKYPSVDFISHYSTYGYCRLQKGWRFSEFQDLSEKIKNQFRNMVKMLLFFKRRIMMFSTSMKY